MKVLVACEESQAVCTAFRERGHEAYSCDIQEPSGGHPEWHILGDALEAVKGGSVTTMDGKEHEVGKWDLLIAHPPCTFLTVSGNRWFNVERYGDRAVERLKARKEAAEFLWHLSMRTFLVFVLRIQLVICQHITASQIVSSNRMNLDIPRERKLAYGLKISRRSFQRML